MTDYNGDLGLKVHRLLIERGIETPMRPEHLVAAHKPKYAAEQASALGNHFDSIVFTLGLNMEDPSIKDTPQRLAKMYLDEICWGLNYTLFPECTCHPNGFQYDEVILVRNIEVKSLCEHHFMPIIGKAHIAYIPAHKVIGLSKFNRIVEYFSRRPQVQERLTEQISAALSVVLETDDIAVIITADHYCVKFRGIEDFCSDTVTSKMSGRFRTVDSLRSELLSLINQPKT
jgi:GTP cyclohydrolase I